jgi:hypothetical protein
MTRRLTKLRIHEISSVDKAAGEGTRIVLMKRHDERERQRSEVDKVIDRAPRNRYTDLFRQIDFSKVKVNPPPDDPDDEDEEQEQPDDEGEEASLSPQMEQAIAALQTHNASLSRADAVYFLLHNPHGRAMFAHLYKKEVTPMKNRTEQLRSIAKDYGVAKLAKHLVDDNDAHGITEHELTALIDIEAQKTRKSGERPASCFARFYSAPENVELRKAIAVAKNAPLMSIEPVQVGGKDATDVNTDQSKAMKQLQALAEEQRRRSPELSVHQAFARVFEANPEIAARAHRRPTPTTSYAFPS